MKRLSVTLALLSVLALSGCTLSDVVFGPQPQSEPPSVVVIVTATPPPPTLTPYPTPTPCVIRTDWPIYTVLGGDTLFRIAQRIGSTVDELARANCLADPSRINPGQQLRVPVLPAPPTIAPLPTFTPTYSPPCTTAVSPTFSTIYYNNPDLAGQLGCPTSYHPRVSADAAVVDSAVEHFERGTMIWVSQIGWYQQPVIYTVQDLGIYGRYNDTWDTSQPTDAGLVPPAGLYEPVRGFGKVWRDNSLVSTLGWATDQEAYGQATIQLFDGGEMIYLPQTGQTFIFIHTSNLWYVRY